jgi:Uma2 family endonuclease
MALAKAALERMQTRQNGAQRLQPATPIPPLENGDRLTRAEFERRYEAMPPHIRAELIEGEVYMSSPVRHKHHGGPHFQLGTWIGYYSSETQGTDGSDNATVRLDLDNEPQPDAVLFVLLEFGGQMRLSEDGYLEGAPELAIEIAASTVSIDLHAKLRAYRRNGVREYLVWRVEDAALDWFCLEAGEYVPMQPDARGIVCSQCFPGLWLDTRAALKGDLKKLLATLRQGLASKEHAAFVKQLKAQRRRKAK